MKCVMLFWVLLGLPASAAAFLVQLHSGSRGEPDGSPVFTSRGDFSFNIGDRSNLTPGLPILVTFTPEPFFGGVSLQVQSSGTFRDVITMSAMLGAQTASVSATFIRENPPVGSPSVSMTPAFAPFSLTVPWETDLAVLAMSLNHDGSIDGAGNGVLSGGGVSGVTITTQSIPEPSVCVLATPVLLLAAAGRRPTHSGPRSRAGKNFPRVSN